MKLRLGTRGSELARWQAAFVNDALTRAGIESELHVVRTSGDRDTATPLAMLGGTGIFTSELDRRILSGELDAAVHSLKDVPTATLEGVRVVAVLEREDPRDVFVPAPGRPSALSHLPSGSRIGTSSLRRRALVHERKPDLEVIDLRGNLDTRLEALAEARYDGAVLALAGLRRLEREHVAGEILDAPPWLPAAGQGALAVVARTDDEATAAACAPLDHLPTRRAVEAERSLLRALGGGCQVPIGALAEVRGDRIVIHGLVASLDGSRVLRATHEGAVDDPAGAGAALASRLLELGARDILAGVRGQAPTVTPP